MAKAELGLGKLIVLMKNRSSHGYGYAESGMPQDSICLAYVYAGVGPTKAILRLC